MKKLLLLLFIIYASTSYAYMSMQAMGLEDTNESWSKFASTGFAVSCESFYGYALQTTEMAYKMVPSNYNSYTNREPSNQPFEVNMTLDLPQDAVITGAWYRINNEWVKAAPENVLDAEEWYDATNHIQPRFLMRELVSMRYDGSQNKWHQIKLGPVYYPDTFAIRITYISKNIIDINSMRQTIKIQDFLINHYYYQPTFTYTIKFKDHDFPSSRPAVLNGEEDFSWVNNWWFVSKEFSRENGSSYDHYIKWSRPYTSEPEFRVYNDGDKQYYHNMMLPPVTPDDRDVKRILLLYDLGTQVAYGHTRDELLDKYHTIARLTLAPSDSINMVYMGSFMPQTLYDSFVPATPANIDDFFTQLKNMNSVQISGLPQLLRASKDYFNASGAGGELWLLSNAQKHCKPPSVANEIMDLSYYLLDYAVSHRIFDCRYYYDYNTRITINGQTYYGNDYLYQNLARMSHGGLLTPYIVDALDLELEISEVFAPAADLAKVDVLPAGGYSFTKYDLNQGKTHYPITYPLQEIGRYEGAPPVETVFYGQVDGETLRKAQSVANPINASTNKYLAPIWNGSYITDLLKQPQSFATIEKIARFSKEFNILTPYCGFVIPAPTGYKGFKRLAELDTTDQVSGKEIEEPEVLPEDYTLGAYPNPFNSNVTIQFDVPPVESDRSITVRIYDVLGRLVREFEHEFPAGNYRLNIRWDGTNELGSMVSTGLYIVQCQVGNVHQTVKITYLK